MANLILYEISFVCVCKDHVYPVLHNISVQSSRQGIEFRLVTLLKMLLLCKAKLSRGKHLW